MNAKPQLFKQTAPDRLEIKKGGGCLILFGLPFFLAGIFMLSIATGLMPVSNANEVPWIAMVIIFFMGLIFSGVGAALVWGRSWTVIDRRQRRIFEAKGLLKPMRNQIYELDNYHKLIIKHDPGDSDTAETFSLCLGSDQGIADLSLFSTSFYGDARDQAKLLMDFLHLPLYDRSTDHEELFQARETEPKNTKPASAPPNYVPELNCRVGESGDEFRVAFQGGPVRASRIVAMLLPIIIFCFFGYNFLPILFSPGTPPAVSFFFGGFFLLLLVLGPVLGFLRHLLMVKRDTLILTIRPGSLELQQRGLISRKTKRYSAEEIYGFDFSSPLTALEKDSGLPPRSGSYQVDPSKTYIPNWAYKLSRLTPTKGVVIKTRDGLQYVGAGLPEEQLSYLHMIISEAFGRIQRK
ncbi:MAG TPA: hypothetical protein PLX59_00880 [Candidatus Cloacimonadota bacterium]|nr:hypothetical protein [Candidatus Cloacimonadota bacterium]